MSSESEGESVDIRDYIKVVRNGKWIIMAAIALATVAAFGVSVLMPPTYQGQATMLLSERDSMAALYGGTFGELPQRVFLNQLGLMQLRPVAELAVRESGLPYEPDDLLGRFSIDPSSLSNQSDLVTVRMTDRDSERAVTLTNAMAQAYIDWSRETRKARFAQAADKMQKLVDEAQAEVNQLEKSAQNSRESSQPSANLTVAIQRHGKLAGQLDTLRGNGQIEDGGALLVSPAVAGSATKVSPKPLTNAALGFALGLVLGLSIVFIKSLSDTSAVKTGSQERL